MTLLNRLESAMIRADGRDNHFIPNNQINEILNHRSVNEEIVNSFSDILPKQQEELVYRICGREGDPQSSLYRKIFAVLLLIGKERSIISFIEKNISDADIPLKPVSHREGYIITALHKNDGSNSTQIELDGWIAKDYRSFLKSQWEVNAPIFARQTSYQDRIPVVEEETIMPWLPDEDLKDLHFKTGHSEVRAIKIHDGHHNFSGPYFQSVFALKKLHVNNRQDPQDIVPEIKTLRRFSLTGEIHLIQLLAAFSWNNECYLLFPWANGGSLERMWQNNDVPLSKEVIIWISDQCHGLAKGLHQIHERKLPDKSPAEFMESESSGDRGEMEFGLHGDIKPANILWFKDPQDSLGAGVLKIADFGLTQFHRKETEMRSGSNEWEGCSPTYRPPEWTSKTEPQDYQKANSRRTDIWGLGCVYLEFVTWILIGHKGIEEFSTNRSTDDQPGSRGNVMREDVFFQIEAEEPGRPRQAIVKDSVREWIRKLHSHSNCTPYLHDFLDLIQNKMLVADKTNRAICDHVKDELGKLSTRCRNESTYICKSNTLEPAVSTAHPSDTIEPSPLIRPMTMPERAGLSHRTQGDGGESELRGSDEPPQSPSNLDQEYESGMRIFRWVKRCCCYKDDEH